jgi:hypothetical protein
VCAACAGELGAERPADLEGGRSCKKKPSHFVVEKSEEKTACSMAADGKTPNLAFTSLA